MIGALKFSSIEDFCYLLLPTAGDIHRSKDTVFNIQKTTLRHETWFLRWNYNLTLRKQFSSKRKFYGSSNSKR